MGIVFMTGVLAAALLWVALAGSSRLRHVSGRGESRRAEHARLAKIAALLLLGLGVGFFLIFAVAELAGGDIAGIQHLPPAALLGALLWLGWKRPRTAGLVVLFAVAVPLTVAVVAGVVVEGVRAGELWLALILPLAPLLTASLFLWAGLGERKQH